MRSAILLLSHEWARDMLEITTAIKGITYDGRERRNADQRLWYVLQTGQSAALSGSGNPQALQFCVAAFRKDVSPGPFGFAFGDATSAEEFCRSRWIRTDREQYQRLFEFCPIVRQT